MTQGTPSVRDPYAWAEHLIYMEAGAELGATRASESSSQVPGIALCGALAICAALLETGAAGALGGRTIDAAMFAMLLGLAVGNSGLASGAVAAVPAGALQPGTRWVVRVVLPLGIMLLGARLEFADLLGVGLQGLALSAGVIALSAASLFLAARWLKLPGRVATLLAAGNGICGGSAVVALAPVIGAREEDVAVSVSTVALLGLVGMLVLPPLGALFGMDATAFGYWSGLSIQQTPQVIAAGFSHGAEAGEIATVVKLVRISLLAPVVVLVGLTYRMRFASRGAGSVARPPTLRGLVPNFTVGLLLLAAIASVGFFPEIAISFGEDSLVGSASTTLHTQDIAIAISKACLVVSMAAVGLETRWATLRRTGPAALAAAGVGAFVVIVATGAIVGAL